MIKHIRTITKPLTQELALEFATMGSVAGERSMKSQRLGMLTSKIENGLFHSPKWAFAWLGGKRFRVNGQHSSTALCQSNGHFPQGLCAVIDEFSCDTEQELAELFEQFDNPISGRTTTDAINAHAKTEASLDDVPISAVRRAVDGIAMEYCIRESKRVSKDERIRLVHTHQEFIRWFSAFYSDKAMSLASVAAAIYATWLKDKAAAHEFWSNVRSEGHPESTHPSRALAKWLREVRASRNYSAGRRYSQTNLYERCVHAWNAFRRGAAVKQLKAYHEKQGETTKPI